MSGSRRGAARAIDLRRLCTSSTSQSHQSRRSPKPALRCGAICQRPLDREQRCCRRIGRMGPIRPGGSSGAFSTPSVRRQGPWHALRRARRPPARHPPRCLPHRRREGPAPTGAPQARRALASAVHCTPALMAVVIWALRWRLSDAQSSQSTASLIAARTATLAGCPARGTSRTRPRQSR
jgi:hypothetical protein